MIKFRIVEIQEAETSHFIVQRKKFFWWTTEGSIDYSNSDLPILFEAYKFNSKKKARKFIIQQFSRSVAFVETVYVK